MRPRTCYKCGAPLTGERKWVPLMPWETGRMCEDCAELAVPSCAAA